MRREREEEDERNGDDEGDRREGGGNLSIVLMGSLKILWLLICECAQHLIDRITIHACNVNPRFQPRHRFHHFSLLYDRNR